MMLQEHKDFLESNRCHYETAKEGWITNGVNINMFVHIYQKYYDSRYTFSTWCKGCILNLIIRIYENTGTWND